MILVDAIYTNQSGSKRLLEYFIRHTSNKNQLNNYFFLFDQRLESEVVQLVREDRRLFLKPGEIQRRKYYKQLPVNISSIFCFGSVPPPIKVKDRHVTILQHNPFFFENPGYSILFKILYFIKRLYIWTRCFHKYDWIVQTQRIKDILIKSLGINTQRISVLPFFELDFFDDFTPLSLSHPLKFIYPADGVPQKNHTYLFRVWERLHTQHNLSPELHITLPSKYEDHIKTIRRLKHHGIKIFNHGFVSKVMIKELYQKSHFLVFPSMSESFGLPLAEAASTGLMVIGADLPYLYQVVEPSAVFDPKDEDSLVNMIVELHRGKKLKQTKVLLKDQISEVITLIQSHTSEVLNPIKS